MNMAVITVCQMICAGPAVRAGARSGWQHVWENRGRRVVSDGGRWVAVTDLVASAWSALGRQLAASRRAAGLSQEGLARLAEYSRSTVANVETDRQRVPRGF